MNADVDFVIIGSGFSGLGMAIRLQQEGRSFVILEKADSVGGTWRENTYPGCACDVPAHLYSFSFEPHPGWSRMYAPQPEIRAYLQHCETAYSLSPHIRFGREAIRARFDETDSVWRVETANGETFIGRYLVLGVGALHRPAYPALPGLERFWGARFHSAKWDHAYELADKRVAVIGTGASAIQFVPQIAAKTRALTLFQRTPPWILPKPDRELSEGLQRFFSAQPWAQRLLRYGLFAVQEIVTTGFVVEPRLLGVLERLGRAHLHRQVADTGLRVKLTPDYRMGCKRILMSDDYYPSLTLPHVEVVTDRIASVSEGGVLTQDGREHAVDAIIFATGFGVTDGIAPLEVCGRYGLDLNDAWRSGMSAHLGTTIAGFPNAFMLVGPNTGLGSNSMVFMIEAQIHYALQCVREAEKRGARTIEVRANAQSRFNDRIQARLGRTVWASGCRSWYLDAQGRNTTLWPGFTAEFWARTRRVVASDYLFDTLVARAPRVQRAEAS